MAVRNSIKINTGGWVDDFPKRASVPGDSILFGCWCKANITEGAYPIAHVNFPVFGVKGANWSVFWLLDNFSIHSDHIVYNYNANCSLYANASFDGSGWAGDYDQYARTNEQTEAEALGWKYCACQIILGASSVTMRQWVKFGLSGTPIKTGDDTKTFTELRTALVGNGWTQAAADAWTPDSLASMQYGVQSGGDGTNDGNILYTKVRPLGTEPSISDINTISVYGNWARPSSRIARATVGI
jgi:hypothetical protein